MKRTELEKLQGKKVVDRMRRESAPERFGSGTPAAAPRREQREREKAAGLVPFAVKLPAELVAAVQARARAQDSGLNELVAGLLQAALNATTEPKASR